MPRQKDITIERKDLTGLQATLDLTTVKAWINGESADVTDAKADSIKMNTPPKGNGPWIILLTTADGKKLLCPLDLTFDAEKLTFDVKQQE
jgi:hypothetical protein